MKWVFLVLLVLWGFYEFSYKSPHSEESYYREVTISNIARVLYHEHSRYTFFVDNGRVLQPITISFTVVDAEGPEIIADVPEGEHMWVSYAINEKGIDTYKSVTIHIHSADDINGGSWDHGKGGRGTTTVVQ